MMTFFKDVKPYELAKTLVTLEEVKNNLRCAITNMTSNCTGTIEEIESIKKEKNKFKRISNSIDIISNELKSMKRYPRGYHATYMNDPYVELKSGDVLSYINSRVLLIYTSTIPINKISETVLDELIGAYHNIREDKTISKEERNVRLDSFNGFFREIPLHKIISVID